MIILSSIFILVSLALFIEAIIHFLFLDRHSSLTKRLLRATSSLILAILTIECAYACQSGHFALPATLLTDIMQAFSLDADYVAVVDRSWNAFSWEWLRPVLSTYSILLYTLAPIAGGAVVYDVLAGVSPSIKFSICKRRELFVFSEINERSILLAESVAARKGKNSEYAIVFTDAYIDSSQEAENELLLRAKSLGAICLQDDLLNCGGFRASRKCHFFLMDMDGADFSDLKNLSTVHQLLHINASDAPLWKASQGCGIYMFSDDSETIENARSIKDAFDHTNSPMGDVHIRKPYGDVTLKIVRDYALTASILLREKPLFQTLGSPVSGTIRPLRVVILGNDAFSHELFKSVFWFGQLLDVQLCITVVYKPTKAHTNGNYEFEDYLNCLCPEIIPSCTSDIGADCLRIWPGEDRFAPPYAMLSFIETDISQENLRSFLDQEDRTYLYSANSQYRLADCDFFLISGKDDMLNIELANRLSRGLMYLHQKSHRGRRPEQVIAFMVQNDDLSQIVQGRIEDSRQVQRRAYGTNPPKMYPYGSLKSRFSYQHVFASEEELASRSGDSGERTVEHGSVDVSSAGDDIYSSWAGIGRIFHLPYKMYCASCTDGSLVEMSLKYRRMIEDDPKLFTQLTWLEHRRWNAFLRVQGFTMPSISLNDLDDVFHSIMPSLLRATTNAEARDAFKAVNIPKSLAGIGSQNQPGNLMRIIGYKDVPSKLHPCLVESDPDYIQNPAHYDMLDLITAARLYINLIDSYDSAKWKKIRDNRRSDVKSYDMPWGDRLPFIDHYEALCWLKETGCLDSSKPIPTSDEDVELVWDSFLKSDHAMARELAAYCQTWDLSNEGC